MSDTTVYTCPYCRQPSSGAGASCPNCGAPVDVTLRVTDGGWTELPPIVDLARIQAGRSSVEISGRTVPIADWALDATESVFFPHHVLRWQDPTIELSPLPLARAWTRHRSGLPLVMLSARGPGHIAFSHDSPGEIVALPIQAGAGIDVGENRLLVATDGVAYDWQDSNVWYRASGATSAADTGAGLGLLNMGLQAAGLADGRGERRDDRRQEDEWHYPVGRYVDRFTAGDRPGLVMIGAGGAAFIRTLGEGETILVKPPALLFKDPTVTMQLHIEYPTAGAKLWRSWGNRYLWLRLWGPGRVGIESCYTPATDPGTDFRDTSQATQHAW
jgi:uncharacterized protein (AIM24 family)